MEAVTLDKEKVKYWAELLREFREEKGITPEDEHKGLYTWLAEKHNMDLSKLTAQAIIEALKVK